MVAPRTSVGELLEEIEEIIDLLGPIGAQALGGDGPVEILPELVAESEAALATAANAEPIRTVHHFACTGGTLIARLLATMPNVTLLSEIDPLSTIIQAWPGFRLFAPLDVLYRARTALRPVDAETAERVFNASVQELHAALHSEGAFLVLRDHPHSHFCTEVDPNGRPTLREMLLKVAPVRSVVTVRHPLDSFLSLGNNNWKHFAPFDLDEYSRRYLAFLDRYEGMPTYRYEDFVADLEPTLERICADLAVPYLANAEKVVGLVSLSGDSGRSSNKVGKRSRRSVPDDILAATRDSTAYAQLCERLGYPKGARDDAVLP